VLVALGVLLATVVTGCEDDKASIGGVGGSDSYERHDARGAPLTLTGLRPAEVPADGGAPVVAVGTGFVEGVALQVGGATISPLELLDEYGTTFLFTAPPGEEGQRVDVVLTRGGQTAKLVGGLRYGPARSAELPDPATQPLSLSGSSPEEVPADGGSLLLLQGTGFVPNLEVLVGGAPAAELRVLDPGGTALAAYAPAGTEGEVVSIAIERGEERALLEDALRYGPARDATGEHEPLELHGLEPGFGVLAGGTRVTLVGRGFRAGVRATFRGADAPVLQVISSRGVVVTAPPGGAAGPADVAVRNPDGSSAALAGGFTYQDVALPAPRLVVVNPKDGPLAGGDEVALVGEGFAPDATVYFGDNEAEVLQRFGAGLLSVLSPPGAEGAVEVRLVNPDGQESGLTEAYSYLPPLEPDPLTVERAVPIVGTTLGGELVAVFGTGFGEATELFFGAQPALGLELRSAELLLALTPPSPPGPVVLSAEDEDGVRVVAPEPFLFEEPAVVDPVERVLSVTAALPREGPASGGTRVAVLGTSFGPDLELTFGGAAAVSVEVLSASAAIAETPPGEPGPVAVGATRPGFQPASLAAAFRYIDDAPTPLTLDAVVPASGPASGGEPIVLLGGGFGPGLRVRFGPAEAGAVEVVSDQIARATLPPGQVGTADVRVERPGFASATLGDGFRYWDDAPTPLALQGLVPDRGPASGGAEVWVLGAGFAPGLRLYLAGQRVDPLEVVSPDLARFELPPGLPGEVSARLELAGHPTVTLNPAFTYVDDRPVPLALTAAVPDAGPVQGGNSVTLAGTGFEADTVVRFGAEAALEQHLLSGEALVAVAPAAEAGVVELSVSNPDGSRALLAGGYRYDDEVDVAEPGLSAVHPNTGPDLGGTAVAIHGHGLQGLREVRVGGRAATEVELVDSTLLLCVTPEGAPGPATVEVELEGGVVLERPFGFFYFDPGSELPAPELRAVAPAAGPVQGGTPVSLLGRGFAAGARAVLGGRLVPELGRLDGATLVGRAPAADEPGHVDVTVFNPDGRATTLRAAFAYHRAGPGGPQVDELRPATVSTLGGTEVVATGSDFAPGVGVFVDMHPALAVERTSAARLVFHAPSHASGAVPVIVVNPDGRYHELAGGLSYRAEPPVLEEALPSEGPAGGFSALLLHGAGFSPGLRVTIGGNEGLNTAVLDAGTILTMTPPGEPGSADVVVTNPGGQSALLADGFTYREGSYLGAPPQLHAVFPPRGPADGGTMLRVEGAHLAEGGRLLFAGQAARSVTWLDPQTASATSPAHPVGAVDLVWLNPDGQASVLRAGFSYGDEPGAPPTIGGLTPNRGPEAGGTAVIVAGSGFGDGSEVFFGGAPAASTAVLGPGFISALSPAHVPGPVTVTVTDPNGRSTALPDGFRYVASPAVLGVQPHIGPVQGGTEIQIGGRAFVGGATVLLAGVACVDVAVLSDNLIRASTPPGLPGTVELVVRNPDGQEGRLADAFEYLVQPGLDDIWPASGPASGGTRAVLSGSDFRPGARVFVGEQEATEVTVVSDVLLTAVVPEGAPGPASVSVRNPDGQQALLPDGFTWVDPGALGPGPGVSGCFPAAGSPAGGTSVRVAGADFASGARAFFGGHPAQTGYLDQQRLSARAPAYPGEAQVGVEVTNPDGQSGGLQDCFAYTDELGDLDAPLVSAVQPGQGPTSGGADLVITGDHFQEGCIVLVGDRLATSVERVDATRIEATTPPGTPGAVSVRVTNPDGKVGWLPDGYRYLAPPRVTLVTPGEGPAAGGTAVTIEGEGFVPGAVVRVGGFQALEVTVHTAERITATTPEGQSGPVEVVVVNPDGQVGSLPAGFYYTPPPVVIRLDPASGTIDGGEWTVVHGSGFRAGAQVRFGLRDAAQVQVLDAARIRARTPLHEIGRVAVTVTNVDGYSDTLPDAFEFIPPPRIQSVAPASGPVAGGTEVTIVGSFFDPAAEVYFGADRAAEAEVMGGGMTIRAVTPARNAGPVAVRVRNPDGQEAVLPGAFVYFPPIPPPVITTISPNFGPKVGGGFSTITGADFQFGAAVLFDGVELAAATVTVLSASQIRVRVPPSDEELTVPVMVRNPDGQAATLELGYTYMPALALPPLGLQTITPNRSGLEGGITATILGNGFPANIVFQAVRDGAALELEIVQYFSPVAVLVRLPAVEQPGVYDLVATIPHAPPAEPESVTLADAIDYRDFGLLFELRRARLPSERRDYDTASLLVDLDADGFRDVFILRGEYRSAVYRNRGGQGPDDPDRAWFDDVTEADNPDEPDYHRRTTFWEPQAADFNKDGFPDVVARTSSSGFHLWESQGHGRLRAWQHWPAHRSTIQDWVITDLNNDGWEDILACTDGYNWWLRNRGLGDDEVWQGFEPLDLFVSVRGDPAFRPAENSYGCDAADITADGLPDIVVANYSNTADRLYINGGVDAGNAPNLVFADVSGTAMFNYSADSRSARFADLDHDGDMDIVMANYNYDDYMLFNTPDGAGNTVFLQNPGALCHDEDCRTMDSVPSYFSPTVRIAVGPDRGALVAEDSPFVDIDRDGCMDLMVWHNGDPHLPRWYLNRRVGEAPQGCTGSFHRAPTDADADASNPLRGLYQGGRDPQLRGIFKGAGYPANTCTLGDLDGDGWHDMFQVFSGHQSRVYFREPYQEDERTYMRLFDRSTDGLLPRDLTHCRRVQAADLNLDGAPDLVLSNYGDAGMCHSDRSRNRIYLNDGSGSFYDDSQRLPEVGFQSSSETFVLADFNGDGYDDIIFFNHDNDRHDTCRDESYFTPYARYYQNRGLDGPGYFDDLTELTNLRSFGWGDYRYAPRDSVAADVDNDGDLDLLVFCDNHSGYSVLFVNGGDPFGNGAPYFFEREEWMPDLEGTAIAPLDFDHDGDLDFFVGRNGTNRLLRNEGLATGRLVDVNHLFIPNIISDNTASVLAGPWLGDEDVTDLFVVNNGRQRIHVALPDHSFGDYTDTNIPNESIGANRGHKVDLDGDGRLDVVMSVGSSRLRYYLNVGNGVFDDYSEIFPESNGESTQDIALADFDGDGDLDVFLCNWGQQNRLYVNRLVP